MSLPEPVSKPLRELEMKSRDTEVSYLSRDEYQKSMGLLTTSVDPLDHMDKLK